LKKLGIVSTASDRAGQTGAVVNIGRVVEEACLTACALFLLFVGAVAIIVLVLA
jgi:hypothetical protein